MIAWNIDDFDYRIRNLRIQNGYSDSIELECWKRLEGDLLIALDVEDLNEFESTEIELMLEEVWDEIHMLAGSAPQKHWSNLDDSIIENGGQA